MSALLHRVHEGRRAIGEPAVAQRGQEVADPCLAGAQRDGEDLAVLAGRETRQRLEALGIVLQTAGVAGIVVHVDATGTRDAVLRVVAAGLAVIAAAEQQELGVRVFVRLRPKTLPVLIPLANRVAPRPVALEILRHDRTGAPIPIPPEAVDAVCRRTTNVVFAGDRVQTSADVSKARPIAIRARYPAAHKTDGVPCVMPWTNLMVLDMNGGATQCCSAWTVGSRGNRFQSSLREIWNGEGYRHARRLMKRGPIDSLCRSVCPRRYDRLHEEKRFVIVPGSAAYVRNQEIMAEDIAEGREEVRCMPLTLGLAPSTYCNYDCIMCACGRTPRRDLPADVWDELPAFMPTLRTITFIGGEPLADAGVMRFLREFDSARWPDAAVSLTTNGSLLTPTALAHLGRCTFSDIIVSLNAGTPDVYEQVQRGLPLASVLANLDALIGFRAHARRPFNLRVGFVVQAASAHTLIPFGEIAASRHLGIRLLPLSTEGNEDLDFYSDADEVARVVAHLDGFAAWARGAAPSFLEETRATRTAILARAAIEQNRPHATEQTRPPRMRSFPGELGSQSRS